MKRCSRCGFECELGAASEYFYRQKSHKDGYQSYCKACKSEYQKQWHITNREMALEKMKQWYADNREAVLKQKKQYHVDNREARAEYNKHWQQNNRDKIAAYSHKRRTIKNGNGGSFTKAETDLLFLWQGGKCAYCDCKITKRTMHRDHIQPISDGGTSNIDNIALACQPCNNSKHNKPLWLWLDIPFALEFFEQRKQFTILLATSKL